MTTKHLATYERLVEQDRSGRASAAYYLEHADRILQELRFAQAQRAISAAAGGDDDDDDPDQDPDQCPECSGSGKCKCCDGTGTKKSTDEKETD